MWRNVFFFFFYIVFFRSKLYSKEKAYFPYDTVLTNLLCFLSCFAYVILAQQELLSLVILVLLYFFLYSFVVSFNLAT